MDLVYKKCILHKDICEDIIGMVDNMCFIIPKKHDQYYRIECLLYKQLLININHYKTIMIQKSLSENVENLILNLNKHLYTKNIVIYKVDGLKNYRKPSRYNVLIYVFALENCSITICGNLIYLMQGEIVLFPDSYTYMCDGSSNEHHLIIGEISFHENNI